MPNKGFTYNSDDTADYRLYYKYHRNNAIIPVTAAIRARKVKIKFGRR